MRSPRGSPRDLHPAADCSITLSGDLAAASNRRLAAGLDRDTTHGEGSAALDALDGETAGLVRAARPIPAPAREWRDARGVARLS